SCWTDFMAVLKQGRFSNAENIPESYPGIFPTVSWEFGHRRNCLPGARLNASGLTSGPEIHSTSTGRLPMKNFLISLLFCLLSLSAWAADTVNINQASAQEIADALQGVGLAKAEEIVRYRDSNGAFKHADEL